MKQIRYIFLIFFFMLSAHIEILIASDYEYVDLGLSVKWANKNVGASNVSDYGDYFAWAETVPKEEYDWSTYKYSEDGATIMTKYNYTSLGSVRDFLVELESVDDAASMNMGSGWRCPSLEEMNELIQQCSWTWSSNYMGSGTAGYIVTSKVEGFTGNFIFLPAAGHYGGSHLYDTNKGGMYWTSSLAEDSFAHIMACQLYFSEGEICTMPADRQLGMTIRGVYGDKKEIIDYDVSGSVQNHEYVDLGLSVQWATCNIGGSNPKLGGDLIAWAETSPKETYTVANYKYALNGKYGFVSKYNEQDKLIRLEPMDDAATVNWGNEWRTPTLDEIEELMEGCDWYNINGCLYGRSKVNDNVIILSKATGCRDDYTHNNRMDYAYYWTSDIGVDPQRACARIIRGGYNFSTNSENRFCGYAVRPVLKNNHDTTTGEIKVQDNLNEDSKVCIKLEKGAISICKDGVRYDIKGSRIH